jgi:predicted anti-sigma-YlaC factor YlaD
MHEPLTGRIEEYLQGSVSMPDVDDHLKRCDSCRNEIAEMKQHAVLLRSLRPDAEADPSAGFYARVLNRIDTQSRQSVWSVFSDSLFAKRLAYASMTFVALVGTYLVSTTQSEQQPFSVSTPEAIIANDDNMHPAVGDNAQQNRETVLVSLASYQQ